MSPTVASIFLLFNGAALAPPNCLPTLSIICSQSDCVHADASFERPSMRKRLEMSLTGHFWVTFSLWVTERQMTCEPSASRSQEGMWRYIEEVHKRSLLYRNSTGRRRDGRCYVNQEFSQHHRCPPSQWSDGQQTPNDVPKPAGAANACGYICQKCVNATFGDHIATKLRNIWKLCCSCARKCDSKAARKSRNIYSARIRNQCCLHA